MQRQTIDRLPSELLAHIFSVNLPSDETVDQFLNKSPSKTAHTTYQLIKGERAYIVASRLALVCKAWHSVWIGTPYLWSTILLDFSSLSANPHHEMTVFRQHIKRSETSLLDISIQFRIVHSSIERNQVLDLLKLSSPRWRTVRALDVETNMAAGVLSQLNNALFLENISLTCNREQLKHIVPTFPIKAISTHLHTVRLFVTHLDFETLQLPWPNLVSLDLSDVKQLHKNGTLTWKDVLDVLVYCPRLKYLKCEASSSGIHPASRVVTHSLEQLVLSTGPSYIDFVNSITLPALQVLTVDTYVSRLCLEYSASQWPGEAIIGLVQRSGCTLTELALRDLDGVPPQVLVLLKHLPSLQKLDLCSQFVAGFLMTTPVLDELMKVDSGGFSFLPNLEQLHILPLVPALFASLVDMACLRNAPDSKGHERATRLRDLSLSWRVHSRDELDKAKLSELLSLREQGVVVSLHCLSDDDGEWIFNGVPASNLAYLHTI